VARRWVVNASPIITLAKIERINLLPQLCDEMVIPQGVADEIQQGGYNDNALTWIRTEGQSFVKPSIGIDPVVASWDLGPGKSHVLSWSVRHPGYEAILDDRAARKAANILQVPVRGTLSIIVLAKQEGCISSAKAEVEKLIESGFRVGADVLLRVLELVGE
jgi:predicted nucleic acid-binding protein